MWRAARGMSGGLTPIRGACWAPTRGVPTVACDGVEFLAGPFVGAWPTSTAVSRESPGLDCVSPHLGCGSSELAAQRPNPIRCRRFRLLSLATVRPVFPLGSWPPCDEVGPASQRPATAEPQPKVAGDAQPRRLLQGVHNGSMVLSAPSSVSAAKLLARRFHRPTRCAPRSPRASDPFRQSRRVSLKPRWMSCGGFGSLAKG